MAWQKWAFHQIALLFEHRDAIASAPPRGVEMFMRELRDLTRSSWARIDRWLEFKPLHACLLSTGHRPRMSTLLQICARAGVEGAVLLQHPVESAREAFQDLFSPPEVLAFERARTRNTANVVRRRIRKLHVLVNEGMEDGVSLQALAASVSLTASQVRRHAPDLAESISRTRKQWLVTRRACDDAKRWNAFRWTRSNLRKGHDLQKRATVKMLMGRFRCARSAANEAFDAALLEFGDSALIEKSAGSG